MKDNKTLKELRAMETNKLVYVISPYRWEVERNVKYAKQLVLDLIIDWYNRLRSHLYHTNFLDDTSREEREIGMRLWLDWIYYCRYYYVWDDFQISEGMKREIELAKKLNLIKL